MGDSVVFSGIQEEMKLFLMSMVLLLSASMTSATMNVGTFWFAQNNGKYYPLKPYTILKAEEENARNLIKQRQEDTREASSFVENLKNEMKDHLRSFIVIRSLQEQNQEKNEERKRRNQQRLTSATHF